MFYAFSFELDATALWINGNPVRFPSFPACALRSSFSAGGQICSLSSSFPFSAV